MPHAAPGVRRVHAANNRNFLHNRQYFEFANFHSDGISIAVGHQPGSRAMASHAKTTRVVNNNEVATAALDKLGTDTGTSASRDDRLTLFQRSAQPFHDLLARVWIAVPVHLFGINQFARHGSLKERFT